MDALSFLSKYSASKVRIDFRLNILILEVKYDPAVL